MPYVWGIRSSDGDGMMGGTGCGHNHQLMAHAIGCLSWANKRRTGSAGNLANVDIFHSNGDDLTYDERVSVDYGEIYDANGRPML